MNVKKIFVFILLCLFSFSCATRNGVHSNRNGTNEVREDIARMGDANTEASINGAKVEQAITESRRELEELERDIENGKDDSKTLAEILRKIRERPIKRD